MATLSDARELSPRVRERVVARRKPIPPPSLELVFLPESDTEYVHFEDGDVVPFEPTATGFSRVNAWWLADAALLSYWDPGAAKAIWERAGLQFEFASAGGTQCHIAWNDSFVIVAFRGTQPDELHDLFDIARFKLTEWKFGGGEVHAGFLDAHNNIWPTVENTLRRLSPARRTIWFTGHSLGAALATLSMDRFVASAGLYTIGSPRVGNRRFSGLFNQRHAGRCYRYVNNRDVVTHLPPALSPAGVYNHVEERRFIDATGHISTAAPSLIDTLSLPWTPKGTRSAIETARRSLDLPSWLIDHTPRRYAVHLWNNIGSRD